MRILIEESVRSLHELMEVVEQLHPGDYQRKSAGMQGASWGKHLRHIIEFYTQLRAGEQRGLVNYDARSRQEHLELDPEQAKAQLLDLVRFLESPQTDRPVEVAADVFLRGTTVVSSWHRELLNAYEHMVHHMALLRIASLADFPYVRFSAAFGWSYATRSHHQNVERDVHS